MINRLKFRVGKHRHACYFAVSAWLSNFCCGFSYPLGNFGSKMESLRKREKVLRIGGEGEKKIAVGCK